MSWEQRNHDFSTAQVDAQVAYIEAEREVKRLEAENAELREQIETLVMYVESDGTRYWVDDDGNQHFDHSATVKDDADKLRELVRNVEHYERFGCQGCPNARGCTAPMLYDERCSMRQEIDNDKRELGIEVDA